MLTIACPTCREQFGLPPALAGKTFSCPACGMKTVIPRPEDIHKPGPSVKAVFSVSVRCLRCSRVLNVEPDKAHGWLACPSCSLVFSAAPPPPPPPPLRPTPPPLPAPREIAWQDEAEDDRDDRPRRRPHRRRKKGLSPPAYAWVAGSLAVLLLLVVGVGFGGCYPFSETRRVERMMKPEIEAKIGVPVESVDLVPFQKGYKGVATLKGGGKLNVYAEFLADGSLQYYISGR